MNIYWMKRNITLIKENTKILTIGLLTSYQRIKSSIKSRTTSQKRGSFVFLIRDNSMGNIFSCSWKQVRFVSRVLYDVLCIYKYLDISATHFVKNV